MNARSFYGIGSLGRTTRKQKKCKYQLLRWIGALQDFACTVRFDRRARQTTFKSTDVQIISVGLRCDSEAPVVTPEYNLYSSTSGVLFLKNKGGGGVMFDVFFLCIYSCSICGIWQNTLNSLGDHRSNQTPPKFRNWEREESREGSWAEPSWFPRLPHYPAYYWQPNVWSRENKIFFKEI